MGRPRLPAVPGSDLGDRGDGDGNPAGGEDGLASGVQRVQRQGQTDNTLPAPGHRPTLVSNQNSWMTSCHLHFIVQWIRLRIDQAGSGCRSGVPVDSGESEPGPAPAPHHQGAAPPPQPAGYDQRAVWPRAVHRAHPAAGLAGGTVWDCVGLCGTIGLYDGVARVRPGSEAGTATPG